MTSPLHKVPIGLLELFRLRTLGRAPDQFGDTLIPVVDAQECYGADALQSSQGTAAVGAINGANPLSQGIAIAQFCFLYGIGGSLTIGAAAPPTFRWQVGVRVPNNGNDITLCSDNATVLAPAQVCDFGFPMPKPIVLRPGSLVFAKVAGNAAGADHSLIPTLLFVPAANLV